MNRKVYLAVMAIFTGITAVKADNQSIDLGKIVVTPYKIDIRADLDPSSTEVIFTENSERRGEYSLTDAIRNIPSLSYKTTGNLGGDTSVFIRGANASHTQVILEGIKLYDPISTSAYFYGYNNMNLESLERIEVLKGPYSVLYGSGSIGGTINLVARKGKGKPHFYYSQETGSYRTFRETFSSEGKINDFSYAVSLARVDIESFYYGRFKDGNHETDPYHNTGARARLDYDLSTKTSLGLTVDYACTKYEYDGWAGADDDDNYAYLYQGTGGIDISFKPTEYFRHKITCGYTRTHRLGWEGNDDDYWYDGRTYQTKWQGDYQITKNNILLFGIDYLGETGESFAYATREAKKTAHTKGYYLENIFTPKESLFFSLAYRLEEHSQFKKYDGISASASYTIKTTGTKLKTSFGQGFRSPSLYELYNTAYGNKNLEPEESESYEAGVEQQLTENIKVQTTYFSTWIKNLIDTTGIWPALQYENVGKSEISGWETSCEYMIGLNTKLTLAHTIMNTKNKENGTRLAYRPRQKMHVGFESKIHNSTVNFQAVYTGNRIAGTEKLKSYILLNASLSYAANKNTTFFCRIENILNEKYEIVDGYQTPEFSVFAGVKVSF